MKEPVQEDRKMSKGLASMFSGGDISAGASKEDAKPKGLALPPIGGKKTGALPPPPGGKPKEEFSAKKIQPKKTIRFADSDDDDSDGGGKKDKNTFKKPAAAGNKPKMSMLFDKGSDDDEDFGNDGYKPSKLANPAQAKAKAKPKPKKSVFAKDDSSDEDEFKPVKKEPAAKGLPAIGSKATKASEK